MQQRTQRDHKKLADEMQIAMAQRALYGMAYPASAYRLCNTHESRDTGYVKHKSASQIDSGCRLVYLRVLTVEDLFDEFFAPIPREGAPLLKVDVRLMKTLVSLSHTPKLSGSRASSMRIVYSNTPIARLLCKRLKTNFGPTVGGLATVWPGATLIHPQRSG